MPNQKGMYGTGKYTREEIIIRRQEELAIRLLDRALVKTTTPSPPDEPHIDVQLDVFERVGKWVGIKNRLDQQGEETQLDSFKRRINAESTTAQKRAHQPDTGGTALRRLQARLPDASAGGDGGDRDDSGGEMDSAA